ncbi:MAG: hypothetical protein NTW18_06780 [Candidatus Omnitrophica bacterium]|nr:hypothetical protein [Candidatus Omnitrophota bacterium]
MKKIAVIIIFLFVLFFAGIYLGYAQVAPAANPALTRTVDVNKDGKADITYYNDGKNVAKIEADTNYDGKPDTTVHLKDGKFESAEVDTNNDGKIEKRYYDAPSFSEWLNKNHSEFHDDMYFSNGIFTARY